MTPTDLAVVAMLGASAYEAAAVWTRKVPTITVLVNGWPKLARIAVLAGALVVAVDHFEVWDFI